MLIDGLALRKVVPRNRLANPAASSLPFPRTVADRPALSRRKRWLIRCPMPFEKLAARAFGFSPPVPVSKKSAKFSFHCRSDRRRHDVGTFNICPMAKEDALRLIAPAFAVEELTNRRGDMQLGYVIRSKSIFAIAAVPVVAMPMLGMSCLGGQSPSCRCHSVGAGPPRMSYDVIK